MPNRKLLIATICVAILIFLSVSLSAYWIDVSGGGQVLYNNKEAYFFIGSDTLGWHFSWIWYPFVMLMGRAGYIHPPDDNRGVLYVIRVTSAGVERYVVEQTNRSPGSGPGWYTPIEGRIWAHYPAIGGLCWWAGNHFEPATQEERQRIDPFKDLKSGYFKNQNGWSNDMVWVANLSIKLDEKVELLLDGGSDGGREPISIQMSKQDQEPVRIFNLDRSSKLVSRSEYRRAFPERE